MSNVIIFTAEDWADEFEYPIFSVTTKEEIEILIDQLKENPFSCGEHEFYFGTNEYFEFSSENIIALLKEAKEISDEELSVLKRFMPPYLGLDIVSRLIDTIKGY